MIVGQFHLPSFARAVNCTESWGCVTASCSHRAAVNVESSHAAFLPYQRVRVVTMAAVIRSRYTFAPVPTSIALRCIFKRGQIGGKNHLFAT
jgi:hypothetical protein